MKTITVYNLDNHPTKLYQEFVDLQGDFKTYLEIKKLADRIAEVGFKYDFYTWESPEEVEHNGVTYPKGTSFIVDAHARQRALQLLEREGYKIPPVPYTRIHANTLDEAKLEILYLNSRYGEIQPTSEFLDALSHQIPPPDFSSVVIPELSEMLTGLEIDVVDTIAVNEENSEEETLSCPKCGFTWQK